MTAVRDMLGTDDVHRKIVNNMLGEEKKYAEKYEDKAKKFRTAPCETCRRETPHDKLFVTHRAWSPNDKAFIGGKQVCTDCYNLGTKKNTILWDDKVFDDARDELIERAKLRVKGKYTR